MLKANAVASSASKMEMPERPICAASLYIKDAARNCLRGVSITTDRCTRPQPNSTERVINRPRSLKQYPLFATHENHQKPGPIKAE